MYRGKQERAKSWRQALGKVHQFVFKMERPQHFELVGCETSQATSHAGEGASERCDEPRL